MAKIHIQEYLCNKHADASNGNVVHEMYDEIGIPCDYKDCGYHETIYVVKTTKAIQRL